MDGVERTHWLLRERRPCSLDQLGRDVDHRPFGRRPGKHAQEALRLGRSRLARGFESHDGAKAFEAREARRNDAVGALQRVPDLLAP
jgi:hypothetical protein